MEKASASLEIYLREYEKLKDEQIARIGFRDNLLYVTLAAFGAVVSFANSNATTYYAFLVLPWISVILGWAYLVNDEKVSAIGRYIRLNFVEQIKQHCDDSAVQELLGWEVAHRSDDRRKRRKIEQLVIDQVTFAASGYGALIAFHVLMPWPPMGFQVLFWTEAALLAILAIEILIYADLKKGR